MQQTKIVNFAINISLSIRPVIAIIAASPANISCCICLKWQLSNYTKMPDDTSFVAENNSFFVELVIFISAAN